MIKALKYQYNKIQEPPALCIEIYIPEYNIIVSQSMNDMEVIEATGIRPCKAFTLSEIYINLSDLQAFVNVLDRKKALKYAELHARNILSGILS